MKIVIPIVAALLLAGVLLILRKREQRNIDPMDLADRSFRFLEMFCQLREEREVLGSAYLEFRREGERFSLLAEMILFFSGSMVTRREMLGHCMPEEMESLKEDICLRVTAVYPAVEIDAGACRICFR